jgi:XTP/dITP diphosphohydrolase
MEIVFATHNNNKLQELQQIVPKNIRLLSLSDIGCHEEIIEDGDTIEANALIKVRHVFEKYGLDCFGDDTGLCVNALNGEPGVYSARYAGSHKKSKDNIKKLLDNLKDKSDRNAHFKTVIAYKSKNCENTFTGICEGYILENPKGERGFGYDPIFRPNGYNQSFAEMPSSLKNKISHRGLATHKLLEFFKEL